MILFQSFLSLQSLEIDSHIAKSRLCIKFSGGGIYFWWKAGVCTYLQEHIFDYNVDNIKGGITMLGSSAGSLASTLLSSNANFEYAAKYAIMQVERDHIYEKKLGLFGIWGNLIEEWLNETIPNDLTYNTQNMLYLTVTPVHILPKIKLISHFDNKNDLVHTNMASIHVPLFLDKQIFSQLHHHHYIDGSFWPFMTRGWINEPLPQHIDYNDVITINYQNDFKLRQKLSSTKFLDLITPSILYDMMDLGYQYMKHEAVSNDQYAKLFQRIG
jgi:hypothetical protein